MIKILLPHVCFGDTGIPVFRQIHDHGFPLRRGVGIPVCLQAFLRVEIKAVHQKVDLVFLKQPRKIADHVLPEIVGDENVVHFRPEVLVDPLPVAAQQLAEPGGVVGEPGADQVNDLPGHGFWRAVFVGRFYFNKV